MSITMDSQDLRGYVRGLCLVAVVRAAGPVVSRSDIERVLRVKFALDIEVFTGALAAFAGIEESVVGSAIEELLQADDEFLRSDNLNLQLGLLSGRPVPVFPFVNNGGVQDVALLRPFLDAAKNLIHAAVRLRMQVCPPNASDIFWRAAVRFLRRMGGDGEVAAAIAIATIANVVSDIIFFNTDAPARTNDPMLAAHIERVLGELRTMDIAAAAQFDGRI